MKRKSLITLCSLALALGLAPLARAENNSFTYQGKLIDDCCPASGFYQMRFKLCSTDAGVQVTGTPVQQHLMFVTNGLFTTNLNFGPGSQVFDGSARWLEIEVRTNSVLASFVPLLPRTELSRTPEAVFAQKAASVINGQVVKSLNQLKDDVYIKAGPSGNVTVNTTGQEIVIDATTGGGGVFSRNGTSAYYNGGNVGIGTDSPRAALDIAGNLAVGTGRDNENYKLVLRGPNQPTTAASAQDISYEFAAAGSAKLRAHRGNSWDTYLQFLTTDYWAGSDNPQVRMQINGNGNVGIGTTSPAHKLDVDGQIHARNAAGDGVAGYNDAVYNGGGVYGEHTRTGNYGYLGHPLYGVIGSGSGDAIAGVGGAHEATGNWGAVGTSTEGVYGYAGAGNGVHGYADAGNGVFGRSVSPNDSGVYGEHSGNGGGVAGRAYGPNGVGVYGHSVDPNGHAGVFDGRVQVNGNMQVCTLTIVGGCDLAEPFQMSEEKIPEGSVVVIDEANPGHLKQATRAYDTRVAGIVSGANGVKAGIALQQEGVLEGGQNVALTGRVYVKADASFGAITPGDLLTTSDTPGHAMKVTDSTRAQGAILGKAMTALADGQGMVLVLVSLQ